MDAEKKITEYSIIAGFIVCSIFPLLIFTETLFIELLIKIADFGLFGNQLFWGILFPLFIIFLFGYSGKKISTSLKQTSYFQVCSQFSFQVSSKLIAGLFAIYIVGLFNNGISVVLDSQIYSQIIFSLIMILFLSFLLMIMTFISSLIIVKLSQNP
ncbi:hypothetical protein C3L50_02965 [Flavobacterium alvei]|uniref:Uncharacterized protein n=1 Tax=Flavobacterium alvei TaxID=2080416 RepID=A0A2S5AH88_9FLAO|nr:hypothetical protein [Flavobacterium alvei]POY41483.1 hypothetical protein C3L50_02965 [Flavobacterium alvei]